MGSQYVGAGNKKNDVYEVRLRNAESVEITSELVDGVTITSIAPKLPENAELVIEGEGLNGYAVFSDTGVLPINIRTSAGNLSLAIYNTND